MNSIVQTQLLKDILENNTLYEVEEIDGELEYKSDENGEKIRICEINEIDFFEEPIHIFEYDLGYITNESKYLGVNEEEQSFLKEGNIPLYTASLEPVCHLSDDVNPDKLIKKSSNKIISFATNGDGSAGRNFIIHETDFYINADRIAIQTTDKVYYMYLYFCIMDMRKKYGYNREYKAIYNNLIKDIIIKIPLEKKTHTKTYTSYELQQSIAKYTEEKFQEIDKRINIIKIMLKIVEMKVESFLDRRINELSKKKNLISLELTSTNEYFQFIKGSRLTKSKVMSFETIENNIPIYSASKFNEEIFGFSSESFLTKNGNVIIKNPSVLINADGSTGITRIKIDNPFALNDVVFAIEVLDQEISLNYIKRMIDNELIKHNLNYSNKLYESDLKSKEIKIKLPANERNIIDYDAINKIDADVEKIQKSNMYLLKIQETLLLAKEKVLQQIINGEI